jgi:hypothetical protein
LVAIVLYTNRGFPARFSLEAQQIASYSGRTLDEPAFRAAECFVGDNKTYADYKPQICLAPAKTGSAAKPSILLVGDSHALQLYPGLAAEFPEFDILQATSAGCVPPLESQSPSPSGCEKLGQFIYGDFLLHHHVDMILLSGRWRPDKFAQIKSTIDFAREHGSSIAIVGPNIEYDTPLPRLVATSMRDSKPWIVEAHRSLVPERLDRLMAVQARDAWHVPYISIYADLCSAGCPLLAAPAIPMLLDSDHLTREGSLRFARAMRERDQLRPIN